MIAWWNDSHIRPNTEHCNETNVTSWIKVKGQCDRFELINPPSSFSGLLADVLSYKYLTLMLSCCLAAVLGFYLLQKISDFFFFMLSVPVEQWFYLKFGCFVFEHLVFLSWDSWGRRVWWRFRLKSLMPSHHSAVFSLLNLTETRGPNLI